ncbi:MAG: hypothetical protein KIB09_04220 [Firmicutes bacterium]|nr:hypothetical protein [Bacillota bacterium]
MAVALFSILKKVQENLKIIQKCQKNSKIYKNRSNTSGNFPVIMKPTSEKKRGKYKNEQFGKNF